jgi:hypothetical protein
MKRWVKRGLVLVVAGFLAIQFVPYGRDHSNPPVVAEAAWDSDLTRDLAIRACFDCHSNETAWPWYSNIAPISWAVQRDVEAGRDELNFSEWHRSQDGDKAAETVRDGSMPPRQYLLLHPEARLPQEQLAALEVGLAATLGDKEAPGERSDDGDDGD